MIGTKLLPVESGSTTLSIELRRNLAFVLSKGHRYDVHCLNAPHVTPGPLSDYYDGRDWQFRTASAARAACRRAIRQAEDRNDGLKFVVVDLRK